MLIGISGKMGAGKNLVCTIIQGLTAAKKHNIENPSFEWIKKYYINSIWEQKAFAGKLKQTASLLTGIPVEKFEDQEFKNKELPEEWDKFAFYRENTRKPLRVYSSKEEANKEDNHDLAWHTLTDYISFDKLTNTSKITSEKDKLAKKAVLQYRIISNECNKTEFDIKLLTGRHHQIRLQLANIGYPLIGDTKYGKTVSNNSGTGSKSGRTGFGVREQLALCSYKLVFDHPATGERMTFELP